MGNQKQALQLITKRLQDVNKAIEFCKDINDEELWEDLITYSIDKPCKYIDKPCTCKYIDKPCKYIDKPCTCKYT